MRNEASETVRFASDKVNSIQKEADELLGRLRTLQGNCFTDPPTEPKEPKKPDNWKKWSKKKKPECPTKPCYFELIKGLFSFLYDEIGVESFATLLGWLICVALIFGIPFGILVLLVGLCSLLISGNFGSLIVAMFNTIGQILSFVSTSLSALFHISKGWGIFITVILTIVFVVFLYNTVWYLLCIFSYKHKETIWNDYEIYEKYQYGYNQYMEAKRVFEKYSASVEAFHNAQYDLQTAEEASKLADQKIEFVNTQITLLQESIQSLHSQKQDLYSIGIIPPDYREMDCVIMLHQIFRNGLKDNMADAILLYEERVFRQEVIRGIDKIYNMLGRLNDSMRAIESRLIEVKQELQMIGSDMSNQLATQEQWQREQLAETRASRYAAEAVQRSNEKYEWYMDQHRRGFM
jgi:hypothetical protein